MQPSDLEAPAVGAPERSPADDSTGTTGGLSFAGLTAYGASSLPKAEDWGIAPGTRLGDVVVVQVIAEGGMGRVYEGLQGTPCRTVAIKVLGPGHASQVGARRFEQEAHIMGQLSHPGIARIFSAGMHAVPGGAVPYFVMEYVEGARTLVEYAAAERLSARQRVELFREACAAVAHGHEKGIVHRDLKPGNILVDAQGRPRVIDFGIARATDSDIALTTMHTDVGQLVGTLLYMAPEQFAAAADAIDVRADVYALGVVLYELLVGRLPYELVSRAVPEVARAVTEADPRPLSTVDPRLRGDLTTIVGKCLEKEPGQRYATAADLAADLGRHLRGEPIAANRPSFLDAVLRLARRHRLAAALACGVVAALVLGVVGTSLFAVRAEQQRRLADEARRDAIHLADLAKAGREVAARERERADAEAALARQRLYAANLLSLAGCLDSKNLRLARQLYDENVGIVGNPLPLEMRCLGARLDEAVVVVDVQPRRIAALEYGDDGRMLAVTATLPVDGIRRSTQPMGDNMATKYHHLREMSRRLELLHHPQPMFFSVGPHDDYRTADAEQAGWARSWLAGPGIALAGDDTPWGDRRPLACSPSGGLFAVQSHDGVRIVGGPAAAATMPLDDSKQRLVEARFNTDGSRLAGLAGDGTLRIWDTSAGRLLASRGGPDGNVVAFRWSDDGSRLATQAYFWRAAGAAHRLAVHDAGDGSERWQKTMPTGHKAVIRRVFLVFGSGGEKLFTSSREQDIHVHDAADGANLAVLRGHAAAVESLTASADGSRLASGAANGHVRVWDADRLRLLGEYMGHEAPVVAVAFSPDGRSLASAGQDGSMRIWAAETSAPLAILAGVDGLSAGAFSPDGRIVAVASKRGGAIELWNARTIQRIHRLDLSDATVRMIAFSPDGSRVAAACSGACVEGGVSIWRVDTGERVATVGEPGQPAATARFSPDGERLLVVHARGQASLWAAAGGPRLQAYPSRAKEAIARAGGVFGMDGARVGLGVGEVFDVATGRREASEAQPRPTTAITASADGRLMAVGVPLGDVHVEDFATGRIVARFVGHENAVDAVAFTADGRRLASGGADGTTRLWDIDSQACRFVLRGHEAPVETVIFTPDGRRLVTTAGDGTVRIWDAVLGSELLSLPGQRERASAVAVGPEGDMILTAADDGRVRIWGLSNAAITAARRQAAVSP